MQTEDKREIAITRRAVIPGSVEAVFEFIAAEDVLPKVLTGYGPLHAVVSTSDHTAPWDQPGAGLLRLPGVGFRQPHYPDAGQGCAG